MKKITILILNYNGVSHLRTFLPSVVRHTPTNLCDVTVADNGSTDASLEVLRSEFPTVNVIELDKNYGFAGGYNHAIDQVHTPYIMLLNSDVEVTDQYIEPLYELMESDSKIAAVMPKLRSYTNREYFEYAGAAGGEIDMLGYPFCKGRIINNIEKDNGQYDYIHQIFWASGAAMLTKRETYIKAGGLDADFFAHMEEIDLCWRMQIMGYKIMIEPTSVVYHLGGGTLSKESPRKTYLNYRNNLAMLYKNLPNFVLPFTLIIRMLLDGLSAIIYLLSGKTKLTGAVLEAHIDFYKMMPELRAKREAIKQSGNRELNTIYQGSVLFDAINIAVSKFFKA